MNPNYTERHTAAFDSSAGRGVLIIRDVQLVDEGRYTCLEGQTNNFQIDFVLGVIGTTIHFIMQFD